MFRTITDEATGATNAIGLFGNSLTNIQRNLKSGQGIRYSLFDGQRITDNDITAIKNYARALDNGSTRAQAFNDNLKGCSVAAKQYVTNSAKAGQSTKELTAGLEAQGVAAKASSIAMKALAVAGNMIATMAIIEGIRLLAKGISKLNSDYADLQNQLSKTESKYNKQVQVVDNINKKLSENKDRIKEILALDNPTYVDLQDLENLKIQNALLKENLELAERAKEGYNKQAINKLQKEFNEDFASNNAKLEKRTRLNSIDDYAKNILTFGGYNIYQSVKTYNEPSKLEQLNNLLDAFEILTNLKAQALNNGGTYTTESLPDIYHSLLGDSADISEIDHLIDSNINTLQSLNTDLLAKLDKLSEYDPNYESDYAKYLTDLINDTTKYLDFDTYINSTIDKAIASSENNFDKIGESIKENIVNGIIKNESDLLSDEDAMKLVRNISMKVYGATNDDTLKRAGSYIIKNLSDGVEVSITESKKQIEKTILDAIDDIKNDLSSSFNSLGSAYADIFKIDSDTAEINFSLGNVDNEMLSSIKESFSSLEGFDTTNLEKFFNTLTDSKSTSEQVQQAFDDLATAYLHSTTVLEDLNDTTVESVAKQLEELGIVNAKQLAYDTLASKKEAQNILTKNQIKTQDEFNKLTYDAQSKLLDEANASDICRSYIAKLQLAEINYNKQGLDVTAKIQSLKNLALAYNLANTKAEEMANKEKTARDYEKRTGAYTGIKYTEADYKTAQKDMSSQIEAQFANLTNVKYNGGSDYQNTLANTQSKVAENAAKEAKKASEELEKSKEDFDWIERKIKNLTDALNDLKDSADDTYSTWANRSNALVNAINTTRQAIDLQQQAYNRYMQQAESVGLSSVYKNLIKNGALDISTITDDDLKNAINQYKEWYDKAQDCLDTQKDLKDSLNELNSKKFDNIESIFNFDKEKIEHSLTLLDNQIDRLEMKGLFANESYYNQMLQYTQKEINSLANERAQLASVMSSSGLSQDSEAWQNMYSTLLKIDEEMDDLNKDMIEFNNNIRNLNWEIFEYLEDSISRITSETEYFVSLLEDKKLFDDNGNFNKYADATVALHATAFDTYKQQAQDYLEEMRDLQRQVVAGAGKDVLEQYNKMVDAHQDAVLAANKEKQAILDLIEDGYKAQLEAIQKVIDKKKEQLNMEKNLYDYQKSITEKTKNITSLEKQQVSLADDDSEETMAKIQQIKVQLEEAKADLEETEYEQYLKDTQDMLDQLATDYENWMNERLDNEDALLSEIVGKISSEGSAIKATLKEVAKENGTTLSTSLNTVFSATSPFTTTLTNSINSVKNAVVGTTTAINNLLNKVASITGTSVSGTNAGTKSSSNTNSTPNNSSGSYGTNNNNSSSNNRNNNTGTNSNSNTNNSNGLVAGIFISKSDSYPKSKLDKEHSIVDRLKYFNFDSSFSARSQYFSKLGGSGTYRGSSNQNNWLISQMKLKGYKKGTSYVPKKDNYLIQEDGQELIYDKSEGSFVTPQSSEPTIVPLNVGDMVFPNESVKRLYELASSGNFGGFANNLTPSINPIAENMKKMSDSLQTTNNINTSNEIHMDGDININLPGVTNYEQFRKELIGDDKFEKAIFTMVGNGMLGKSTIEKYKYVR